MEFDSIFVWVFGFLAVLGAGAILYTVLKPLLFPNS
jgi:hypothetical protein